MLLGDECILLLLLSDEGLLLLGEEGLLLCLQMRRHRDGCQRRTRTPWPHLNGTHPWVVETGPGVTTGGRLLAAGRLLLLLLGARRRAVASSAVVATRAPLSTAVVLAAAIAVGGLRAASAPEAHVGRG